MIHDIDLWRLSLNTTKWYKKSSANQITRIIMSELLPSFITLTGFLLPAGILIKRRGARSAGDITHSLLIALFCMFGGLLFAGALISVFGDASALLNSAFVLIGALVCVVGQQWVQQRRT